jgi:imidazolonepropionase-like amidohydrolase
MGRKLMSHRFRPLSTLVLLCSFSPSLLFSQSEVVVIQGARLVTITLGDMDDGDLIIRGGEITGIGANLPIPAGAEVIDGTGKTVLPGFIDGCTNLGAADYPSLGADDDEAIDPVTPQLRITDGFNPDNRFIPKARSFGVTTVLSTPAEGNLISGQSALIDLAGTRIEDMTVLFPVGVHATLGEAPKLRYGPKSRSPMTRMGAAALLRQTLIDARAYVDKIERYELELAEHQESADKKKPTPPKRDLKLEALIPVVRAEMPLIVSADRFDDIHTALRIGDEFGLKIILNHGAEAHRLTSELSSRKIPVIWGPSEASYDELESQRGTPTTPYQLHKAGILFAFQTGSVSNLAGLLQQARSAVVHGLPRDEALEALTLSAATIFGVSDELGSLEAGKTANIVVFDGDPLEQLSKVEMVFIKGVRFDVAQ